MDLTSFAQLGASGLGIVGLVYVCFKLIRELAENRKDYSAFVESNNHTTTDLVKEATATMVEVKNTIATHNELLKVMIDKVK